MTSSCGKTIGASSLEQRGELLKRATSVWRNQRDIAWDLARPPSRDPEGGALLSVVQQTAAKHLLSRWEGQTYHIRVEREQCSGMKKVLSDEA
jgi:hypothetical protein